MADPKLRQIFFHETRDRRRKPVALIVHVHRETGALHIWERQGRVFGSTIETVLPADAVAAIKERA